MNLFGFDWHFTADNFVFYLYCLLFAANAVVVVVFVAFYDSFIIVVHCFETMQL